MDWGAKLISLFCVTVQRLRPQAGRSARQPVPIKAARFGKSEAQRSNTASPWLAGAGIVGRKTQVARFRPQPCMFCAYSCLLPSHEGPPHDLERLEKDECKAQRLRFQQVAVSGCLLYAHHRTRQRMRKRRMTEHAPDHTQSRWDNNDDRGPSPQRTESSLSGNQIRKPLCKSVMKQGTLVGRYACEGSCRWYNVPLGLWIEQPVVKDPMSQSGSLVC
jgi:hypothetical protein